MDTQKLTKHFCQARQKLKAIYIIHHKQTIKSTTHADHEGKTLNQLRENTDNTAKTQIHTM